MLGIKSFFTFLKSTDCFDYLIFIFNIYFDFSEMCHEKINQMTWRENVIKAQYTADIADSLIENQLQTKPNHQKCE